MAAPKNLRRGAEALHWKGEKRLARCGYVLAAAPNHPKAMGARIYEHVLVVERAMGKYLPPGAQVHHRNEDKTDNRPQNLVVCQDRAYHILLHQRTRALRETGNPWAIRCHQCGEWGDRRTMRHNPAGSNRTRYRHHDCHRRKGKEVA